MLPGLRRLVLVCHCASFCSPLFALPVFEGFGYGTEATGHAGVVLSNLVSAGVTKTFMAAPNADNEVFLTIALPGGLSAAEETRAWRLQCLREADGVQSVLVVEESKARCGPFLLGDEAAVPPLLYAFACAAADANMAWRL